MDKRQDYIKKYIYNFIKQYTHMNINGVFINCPYWMNKIKKGKVLIRGFANGKGAASQIREELGSKIKNLSSKRDFDLKKENIRKLAKRKRIGIDCSGYVYRILEELIHLNYLGCQVKNLSDVFKGGIDKTNSDSLTSKNFTIPIDKIEDFRLGDLIRMRGGKHVAVIIERGNNQIIYTHSSNSTKIQGVHTSIIQIIEVNRSLRDQLWTEETRNEENFGKKYFNPEKGDGVFRLKIFF